MKRFGLPAISVSVDSCLESTGDKRLILQSAILDTVSALLLNCSAKTLIKSNTSVAMSLLLTMGAKTRVITAAVPNLVLVLVASAKTLSKATAAVSLVLPPDPALLLQLSSKTISKVEVIITRRTLMSRINGASIRLITEPWYANLRTQ
jgi:hypothetical protein